jgi:DNA-binding CsgD family transcriptional regulator
MTASPSQSTFLLDLIELLGSNPDPSAVCQYLAVSWPCEDPVHQTAIMEVQQDASLHLAGWFGFNSSAVEPLARVSMWDELPAPVAIREQRTITLTNKSDVAAHFPNILDPNLRIGGLIVAPISAAGRTIGACAVINSDGFHSPESSKEQLLEVCLALGLYLPNYQRAMNLLNTGPIQPIQAPPNGHPNTSPPNPGSSRNMLVPNHLTERQLTVLQYLAQRLTNRHIAMLMGFSESTIRQETMAIYAHLSVHGRHEAVEAARIRGMIKPDPFDDDENETALVNS